MILIFGLSIWLLIIELIWFGIWVAFVQIERWVLSTITMIAGVVGINYLMNLSIFTYIKNHPLLFFSWLGIGLVCGILWSIINWILFLLKFNDNRRESLEYFYKTKEEEREKREHENREDEKLYEIRVLEWEQSFSQLASIGECVPEKPSFYPRAIRSIENKTDFEFLSQRNFEGTRLTEYPKFKNYKGKIVGWVIFWIPSLIGTFLDYFVPRLVRWIIERFGKLFEWLSNRIVGKFVPEDIS